MKKLLVVVFCCAGLLGCSTQYRNVKKVELIKSDFYSCTVFGVSCDEYGKNFKGEERERLQITDKDTISLLCKLVYTSKRDTSNYNFYARAKLWIHFKNRIDIICLTGGNGISINGEYYIVSDELISLIERIPPNTEWKYIE